MALTRKFLSALGIDAEKVDEIIAAHTDVTDSLKAERDSYKSDAEKLAEVQKELDTLKAAGEKDPFKVKYEAIKEEYENYKKDQDAKELAANKSVAYRALLKEAGVSDKRIDAVLKVSDIDSVELDKEGKIKDASKLIETIKSEWSDFIQTESSKGVDTPNPPSNTGNTYKTKEEIYSIKDTAQRQQAILENHELFGI